MDSIIVKYSQSPGVEPVPNQLLTGEPVMNTYDGRLFMKKSDINGDSIVSFVNFFDLPFATVLSASFSSTASFVTRLRQNVFITGSLNVSGSVAISGSLSVTSGVVNQLTASYALNSSNSNNATSASYATNANTASYVQTAQTASYVLNAISSSYGATSSYADNFTVGNTLTAQRIVVQIITSSVEYVTGSTRNGSLLSNTHEFTGSILVSGSINSASITGSLFGSASFATTSSFGITASFVTPLRQNVQLTGSLFVTSSTVALSLIGSGSGVFSVDGTSGRLFSIDDSLSGSLFSVNTAAGLPVIEAFSDNTVRIGQFGQRALFVASNRVGIGKESPLNASLDVSGSVVISGSLTVSGSIGPSNISDTYFPFKSGSVLDQSILRQTNTGSLIFGESPVATSPDVRRLTINSKNYSELALFVSGSSPGYYMQSRPGGGFAFTNGANSGQVFNLGSDATGGAFQIAGGTNVLFAGNVAINWPNIFTIPSKFYVSGSTRLDGTLAVSSSVGITGSLSVLNGITGSLLGTSSFALTAQTASFVLNAISASYVLNSISSSFATTASYAQTAQTASFSNESRDIILPVKNVTGVQINKGTVVRINGSTGDNALISPADWTSDNVSANTIGLTTANIPNDTFGYVMTEGTFIGYDTSTPGWTAGQLVFLGASGSITGSNPQAPLHGVRLGQVLRVQQNNGSIYIRIDNGIELGEAHDVRDTTTTSSYGDLLVKSGSVWFNSKQLTGSYALTGSLNATSFIGSLQGSASHAVSASYAVTASFVLGQSATSSYALSASNAISASYVLNAVSSSYALTASFVLGTSATSSYALSSSNAVSASYAVTASFVLGTSATSSYALSASNAVSASFALKAPYSGLVGTVPTWNQNTTGTASFASNATDSTKLPLAGGTLTGNVIYSGDTYSTYGPNSTWASYLRVGGNGRTVSGTTSASVVTTNGNLHIDGGSDKGTYINYYAGTAGIAFGTGAGGVAASVDASGNIWKGGTIGAGTQYVFNSGTWGISISGNANTAGGLAVHSGRNNEADKIVRTQANGYILCGYINSSNGNENNNSSPDRVWGTNGGDDYLRTYRTTAFNAGSVAYLPNRTDGTAYQVLWGAAYTNGSGTIAYSCSGVTITSSTGTLTASGITETSSKRYKENIISLGNSLDKVIKLRGVKYNKIGNDFQEIGVIAEEVEKVVPEFVVYNEEGQADSVNYGRITALLIEGMKEQQLQIEQLKAEIQLLKSK